MLSAGNDARAQLFADTLARVILEHASDRRRMHASELAQSFSVIAIGGSIQVV